MGAFIRFIGPSGLATLLVLTGISGWYGWQKGQIWWQKDRRAYCEAKLTDYELKSKAALEKMTLERNDLKARLETNEHEHKTRVDAMRARHERAFDSLSAAYQDSCQRMSEITSTTKADDDRTGNNGFHNGVATSLTRIARISDEQAERLKWCQSWVRSVTNE